MAVDVAAPRPDANLTGSRLLARAAAVPTWAWLGGLIAASVLGRFLGALGRVVPYYLPDEYIYPSLARNFAEHGRPLIRGASAHFPALLDPLLTAPVWLVTSSPETAWRLTQGVHAVAFALAALPAYGLARRVGVQRPFALCVAALALAVPDGVYAGSMLADPIAYPLALAALWAGIGVVAEPARRAQFLFALFSALSILARIQYAAVPVAVLLGAVAADRFRVARTVKRLWLSIALLVVPPLVLLLSFGHDRIFGVYAHPKSTLHAGSVMLWIGRDLMLLAYTSGWILVPGALVGVALALWRPRTRAEIGFGVAFVTLAGALLFAAAQIADTDSQRFQERYLFVLIPLVAIAFALYVQRGLPGKLVVSVTAVALLAVAARIPLSGYAAAHNKDDSPTLWAVLRLERLVSIGNGALAISLVAAGLSGLAVLIGARRLPALGFVAAVAACCALSAGATSFDAEISQSLRTTLPSDVRWIDDARIGNVDVLAPPGARKEQSWEQLFWNTSARRLLVLGSPLIDHFATGHVRVARDGTMLVNGQPLRRALAVQTYASTVEMTGVERIRHELIFNLYRPAGTPRLRLLAAGRYADKWLTPRGAVTVWSAHGGTLTLDLSLPAGTQTTSMRFNGRRVVVQPGKHVHATFRVPSRGRAWSLHWTTKRNGYLTDNRAVSVLADRVSFRDR